MTDILETIAVQKRVEIATARMRIPLPVLEARAKAAAPVRGFCDALKNKRAADEIGLIAEIKKASPSKGIIRADFGPAELAHAYEKGGAACLSVLTDEKFFQGHNDFLNEAREACPLPVLRKDFLLDPYQVVESRAIGADCILIIMAAIDDACARELWQAAREWKLDVLVEVHNEQELARALKLDVEMIGINNRNLKDFNFDLEISERLARQIPAGKLVVSESGISTPSDIKRLGAQGISTFLIGETFMREDDVTAAVMRILK